jgi:hypothetical protein
LKSQQEQLALLQKKLAEETKPSENAGSQPSVPASGGESRVIAVEPAGGGTNSAPATAAASGPSQAANAPTPEDATKLAAAESKGAEEATPQAAKTTEAPLPQGASRQELLKTFLPSSSGSAAILAPSTPIGAHAHNRRLIASTGSRRLSFRSMSRNRRASTR